MLIEGKADSCDRNLLQKESFKEESLVEEGIMMKVPRSPLINVMERVNCFLIQGEFQLFRNEPRSSH